ncbi:YraN family protein [Flavobacteriales bacterium]|jgi:putative endonuclease|nr:YraN family protein [Flavobacteriales bacterium]
MRNPQHIVLGQQGEKLARLYLLDKGYILLEKNYFYKKLEVDLIAEKDNEIVFVEVKTRRKYDMGGPEASVDRDKEENLLELSEYYMNHFDLDLNYRIDIISVILNNSDFAIHHFENAGEYFLSD